MQGTPRIAGSVGIEGTKPKLVSVPHAAKVLGVGEHVIRTMVRTGQLKGMKLGGRYKIVESSLRALRDRLLESCSSSLAREDRASGSVLSAPPQ